MAKRLSVVLSQGQSNNPIKRRLEEDIVTMLLMEEGIDVTVVPNLYDLTADGTGMLAMQGIQGNLVVLSWHFPRAAHWTLDRNDIRGREGKTLLVDDKEEEDEEEQSTEPEEEKARVIDERPLPARTIYCINLGVRDAAEPFITEIKRIAAEQSQQVVDLLGWVGGSPKQDQLQRFVSPTNDTALGESVPQVTNTPGALASGETEQPQDNVAHRVEESAGRRWYPVIDYSRCTNCMECIDFCLFGVYGVDTSETILVEQPDNCRKGCPACSRVCPENAIIFPQHKAPDIAGANGTAGALKIDLSKLFGAPDAAELAARERDEQLVLAGREAVGMDAGIPKRQQEQRSEKSDDLDDLLDELDDMDL